MDSNGDEATGKSLPLHLHRPEIPPHVYSNPGASGTKVVDGSGGEGEVRSQNCCFRWPGPARVFVGKAAVSAVDSRPAVSERVCNVTGLGG